MIQRSSHGKTIKNFEHLTGGYFIFLKHPLWLYKCNILRSIPSVGSHPRCSIISQDLIFIEHSPPTQLSQLPFDLLAFCWTCSSHSYFYAFVHVILLLKCSSHLTNPIAPLCLRKPLSVSSSTKSSSSTLTYFQLPKVLSIL